MRPEEARRFLEIHHAAVRDIAAKDYPASVVEVWAPLPITDEACDEIAVSPLARGGSSRADTETNFITIVKCH